MVMPVSTGEQNLALQIDALRVSVRARGVISGVD
jgi:hypothetical protein